MPARARMPANISGQHADELTLRTEDSEYAQTHTAIGDHPVCKETPPREINPSAYTVKNTFIEATDADNEMLATRACAARFSSEQPRQPLHMDGDSTGSSVA